MFLLSKALGLIKTQFEKYGILYLFLVGFWVSFGVLGFTFFLEIHVHLVPCSLCIFQRVFLIISTVIFLIFLIHVGWLLLASTAGQKTSHDEARDSVYALGMSFKTVMSYAVVGFLMALIGLAFSLRQIYLQSLPPSAVPGCGPGLNFLFQAYPVLDALKIVLQGSGDCAKIDWRGLGLSLADWAGIYFVFLIILNVVIMGVNKAENGRSQRRIF